MHDCKTFRVGRFQRRFQFILSFQWHILCLILLSSWEFLWWFSAACPHSVSTWQIKLPSGPLCCVYSSDWRPLTTDTIPVRRLGKVREQKSSRAAMPIGKRHPQHTFSNLQSETFLCSVHLGPSMIPPLLSRVIRFLPASQGFDKWPCASGPTPHFPLFRLFL